MNAYRMIKIGDTLYEVPDLEDEKDLEKGFAYERDKIDKGSKTNLVYIYGGKIKDTLDLQPGYFYKIKGTFKWCNPSKEEIENYSADLIKIMDKDQIIDIVNDDKGFRELDPAIVEDAGEIYAPEILDDDDVFKIIIKKALALKKISLRLYKDQFNHDYDITNLKQSLRKKSVLSNVNFHKWVEALDLNVTFQVDLTDTEGNPKHFEVKLK